MSTEFIYGFHAVQSRLRSHPESVEELYVDAERKDQRARNLLQLAEEQKSARLAGRSHTARRHERICQ